ncbi:hypothetical protein CRUP_031297 [Coryphaenoides rupestris]|nr:hypothetical protein CRUP_031297 [Coryphaenoides rupestris]
MTMVACVWVPAVSEVALAVQRGGEGHVVQGPRDAAGPRVRSHAGDAVLSLVRGKLPPQLLRQDVALGGGEGGGGGGGVERWRREMEERGGGEIELERGGWRTGEVEGWVEEERGGGGDREVEERGERWSTLKEAITWSAVSVSAVSRDMKSMKAWKVTTPRRLGSTMLMMRENSASP